MAATYWVLIADELITDQPDWGSVGLDVIHPDAGRVPEPGGMHWWKVWDEFADPCFEGQRVELEIGTRDGNPFITSRRKLQP